MSEAASAPAMAETIEDVSALLDEIVGIDTVAAGIRHSTTIRISGSG